ncbi:MAG: M81 family metallopeptidase [Chromatiales bacterium]|jgi:microcystin degradation protein MlrC|nr:M81 family metallopeptidase [Chromatiales bacterium]
MHIVIAQMSHETNTFSPVVTDLARFSRAGGAGPVEGDVAKAIFRGTASCMGGYLSVAEGAGADIIVPIAAGAPPSGPVEDDAYEYMVERIVAAARSGCDAIMLDLHGAMVTRSFEDGEGELLRRIREVAPEVPIAVALDMHANIYPAIVDNATIITGYHTYPHIDMDGTARRAGRILLDTLAGKVNPIMEWGNAPMLPHVMRQGTDDFPNQALQQRVTDMEGEDALAVALFTGFPHADIEQAGLSVIVVTDGDASKATAYRDELLDRAWADREAFVYDVEPLSESVARAKALGAEPAEGPVLLLDHYDNTASGGTMDTTEVLAEIFAQGLEDVAVFGFFDPAAVSTMVAAGVGNEVTVSLGGKLPMPALERQSKPIELTGRVKLISDGSFPATVQMSRGLTIQMGTTAVLSVGSIDIIVVSKHIEPFDPGCMRSLGIEPTARRHLMLKSRIHYRVGFKPLVREVVECAGVGVCTSDYSQVTFENVRRPIYPLDVGVNTRERIE